MIKDIRELNFPSYATLHQATVNLQDMGEKTITTQVKIDGQITPDFSYDWEVEFKGEKYIMPLRQPQGAKENTSLNSVIDLTFQHWPVYQLKRWYFFSVHEIEAGTVSPDKYITPVSLNLGDFCILFNKVLDYYFNGAIRIDLNPDWIYKKETTTIEISYSYLWDVLIQLYDLYAVRWVIEAAEDTGHYVIRVGYGTDELGHVFEYGFDGGLLKVERQVQSSDIRNMILGRGGDKNLPLRYFKDYDDNNELFDADPDWIPELADIYFSELRGATFRSYIQGWNHRKYGRTSVDSADKAYAPWAWIRGNTDERFNPVEFVADEYTVDENGYGVKDGSSIAMYGPLMGGLENNDDFYPTIQGVNSGDHLSFFGEDFGRVDEVIEVEVPDDIQDDSESDAALSTPNIDNARKYFYLKAGEEVRDTIKGPYFTIPSGKYGNLDIDVVLSNPDVAELSDVIYNVYAADTGEKYAASGIPYGYYYCEIEVTVRNITTDTTINVCVEVSSAKVYDASISERQGDWSVLVKNIWRTSKRDGETDVQYADRVWKPILGDRIGSEAKMMFSSGWLSMSEDYEFIITDIPKYEKKRCSWTSPDGTVHEYYSEWRIPLGRSDADLESTGLYLPGAERQAEAGDYFFFIGIDMPHAYVIWAEEDLDSYKKDQLELVKEIRPTWVVSLDKIRITRQQEGETLTLISQLKPGCSMRLADKRFILNDNQEGTAYETLYVQSITYTYSEPTSDSAALIPDVEVVLGDNYVTNANPVTALQGEVNALSRQIGSISNVEQIVRVVGDRLYLRKDGIPDRSMSATEFASLVTSLGFRRGMAGGEGWGFFKDGNGNWVLETDRINVRQEFQVNNLVVNQITVSGGMEISSAAAIEITEVYKTDGGYECHFDTRGGSVANLFVTDDVAYCNRFTAENKTLKFYKRRVTAVGEDFITLSETQANGSGLPEKGDVVVQYGNYSADHKDRRYVTVRDVIDGGYERYIEGLDSVDATGTEYYFVGRQAGMYNDRPRFFIGDSNGYVKYENGEFSIKGRLSLESTVGDKKLDEYIQSVAGEAESILVQYSPTGEDGSWHDDYQEGDNYMRQSTDNGQTWTGPIRMTGIAGADYTNNLLLDSDTPVSNSDYLLASYTIGDVKPAVGEDVTITIWGELGEGKTYFFPYVDNGHNHLYPLSKIADGLYSVKTTWQHASESYPAYDKELRIYQYPSTVTATSTINLIKLESGHNDRPVWTPYAKGTDGSYTVFQWARSTSSTFVTGTWQDSPMTPLAGEYIWMRSRTIDPSQTTEPEWSDPIRLTGEKGTDGESVYLLDIQNENITVPATNSGVVDTSSLISTTVTVYKGGAIDSGWTFSTTATGYASVANLGSRGVVWITSVPASVDTLNIPVKAVKDGDSNAPQLSGNVRVTKAKSGADGSDAVIYELQPSTDSISKDFNGTLSDSYISCNVMKITGSQPAVSTTEKILKYQRIGVDSTPVTITPGDYIAVTDLTEAVVFLLYDSSTDSVDDWIDRERVPVLQDASNMDLSGDNLILNSTFKSNSKWRFYNTTAIDETKKYRGFNSVKITSSGNTQDVWIGMQQAYSYSGAEVSQDGNKYLKVESGERYVFSIYCNCDDWTKLDQGAAAVVYYEDDEGNTVGSYTLSLWPPENNTWYRKYVKVEIPENATRVRFHIFVRRNGNLWLALPKFEKGNVLTEWSASPYDFDYIQEALKEPGSFEGGLILASLMRLGYTQENGEYKVMSGLSGIVNPTDPNGGFAMWAGGSGESEDNATFGIRHDGTAFAAGKTIQFNLNEILVGNSVVLDDSGLALLDSTGTERLRVANVSVGDNFSLDTENQTGTVTCGISAVLCVTTGNYITFTSSTGTILSDSRQIGNNTIKAGATIEITFDSGYIMIPPPSDIDTTGFYAQVILKLYTMSGSQKVYVRSFGTSFHNVGDNLYQAQGSLSYMATKSGLYYVEVEYSAEKDAPSYDATTVSIPVKYNIQTDYKKQTILGNDGLLSVWGNTALLIRDGYFSVVSGNNGIRITPSEVKKILNGTATDL